MGRELGVMKETKRSLVSRSSTLFHFSISLSPSSYFFFLSAYSDNLNSDLAGTEKCREPGERAVPWARAGQVKPSHGDRLQGMEARGSAPHKKLFQSQR